MNKQRGLPAVTYPQLPGIREVRAAAFQSAQYCRGRQKSGIDISYKVRTSAAPDQQLSPLERHSSRRGRPCNKFPC
jgi:hypothetical protein